MSRRLVLVGKIGPAFRNPIFDFPFLEIQVERDSVRAYLRLRMPDRTDRLHSITTLSSAFHELHRHLRADRPWRDG